MRMGSPTSGGGQGTASTRTPPLSRKGCYGARLRTTAFPEPVCGSSAATARSSATTSSARGLTVLARFVGGSGERPPKSERRSPLAPARADGRCHASWETHVSRALTQYDLWSASG
jgi:hypothetical protein